MRGRRKEVERERGRNSLEESSFSKGLPVYFQIARPAKGINVGAKTARPCHFPARLPPTEKVTMSSRLYVLHMWIDPAARDIYRVSRWVVITVANCRISSQVSTDMKFWEIKIILSHRETLFFLALYTTFFLDIIVEPNGRGFRLRHWSMATPLYPRG